MEEITLEEFLGHFDPEVRSKVLTLAKLNPQYLVEFVNHNFDSSRFGAKTAVCVGPEFAISSIDSLPGKFIGDLPSERQYPQYFVNLMEEEDE